MEEEAEEAERHPLDTHLKSQTGPSSMEITNILLDIMYSYKMPNNAIGESVSSWIKYLEKEDILSHRSCSFFILLSGRL